MSKRRNHIGQRQRISAIVLLMVMMVQMGFKTLHLHHNDAKAEVTCSDCEHHRMHGGHILAWDGHSDDCPLCLMLHSPYVPAHELRVVQYANSYCVYCTNPIPDVQGEAWCFIVPRAPPSCLLLV